MLWKHSRAIHIYEGIITGTLDDLYRVMWNFLSTETCLDRVESALSTGKTW